MQSFLGVGGRSERSVQGWVGVDVMKEELLQVRSSGQGWEVALDACPHVRVQGPEAPSIASTLAPWLQGMSGGRRVKCRGGQV